MADVTPEERKKIYEEEKARVDALAQVEETTSTPPPATSKGLTSGKVIFLVIVGLVIFAGIKSSIENQKSKKPSYTSNYSNSKPVSKNTSSSGTKESAISEAISYLKSSVKEIQWIEIDSNNVYLGFSSFPSDGEAIVKGAALNVNKATNFGAHVWAVEAKNRGWRPGKGRYYYEATARYGKIE